MNIPPNRRRGRPRTIGDEIDSFFENLSLSDNERTNSLTEFIEQQERDVREEARINRNRQLRNRHNQQSNTDRIEVVRDQMLNNNRTIQDDYFANYGGDFRQLVNHFNELMAGLVNTNEMNENQMLDMNGRIVELPMNENKTVDPKIKVVAKHERTLLGMLLKNRYKPL